MPDSNRSSKGFAKIPENKMGNPNDATIDIPLSKVDTRTGARKASWEKQQPGAVSHDINEKAGFYQRHVAGRRKAAKKTGREDVDREEVTSMGKIYERILNFSIVTRYFLYILPIAALISIPIIIGATATPNATIGGVRIVWFFSWLLIVWVGLWGSKLTAKLLPTIFEFLCGIISSGTRKYALVLKNLEIYLSLCGWALVALATFVPVMTNNPTKRAQQATYNQYHNSTNTDTMTHALLFKDATVKTGWESVVERILAALMVASLIVLAEKLLIQLISISYHRTQLNEKIKDSKHKIYLLGLLYDASRSLFPAYCPEFAEEDYIINDSIGLGDSRPGTKHHRSGSATPMRLLQNAGRFGDKLTSAFGNIAHEVTGKDAFNPNSAHSIVVEALEKNRSAEALAKRLWMSFVVEGKEALYREDVFEVLGADHHGEADEAFDVLDQDGNGDISLSEMILTICDFGRVRHAIANSLHDVDNAIGVLDNLLCTIIFVVIIFVFVAFLNTSFTTTLATAGTALLSLSFVFAGTAQEILGSCIFLFAKHPFDNLDRVDIGDDKLVVQSISLLFTVFRHVNSSKLAQVPNSVLNTLWIHNVSRSEAMKEQLTISVSFDTTLEDIQLLKNELHAFVTDKENSRDFQPDVEVEITDIAAMGNLQLTIDIRHKSNWSNETVRAARRSKFMCALVLALRKIPINAPGGGGAALGSEDKPSYSVTVSDQQAASNRAAFEEAKDAKRLFPNKKSEDVQETAARGLSTGMGEPDPRDSATPPPLRHRQPPTSESTALNSLNTRNPAADTALNPKDVVEPTSPISVTRSVSGATERTDVDRTTSINEVRNMLRRESTRGKRHPPSASTPRIGLTSSTTDNLPRPNNGSRLEYDPYAYNSHSKSNIPARKDSTPKSVPESPQTSSRDPSWPQPPTGTYLPKPTISEEEAPPPNPKPFQQQQTPAVQPVQQTYSPSPPPKEKSYNNLKNPDSTPSSPIVQPPVKPRDPAQIRAPSPVRNPFQIHALRSQAQGGDVPRAVSRPDSQVHTSGSRSDIGVGAQSRRPVPGNGNTFAKEQSHERPAAAAGIVRPARSDSLGGSRLER